MELVVVLAVLAIVVVAVGSPIYRAFGVEDGPDEVAVEAARQSDRDAREVELEAEREAKLREIRDAELDWRTGKLGEADWRELDSRLRADAARLLREEPTTAPVDPGR